jgi:hypothetical protein
MGEHAYRSARAHCAFCRSTQAELATEKEKGLFEEQAASGLVRESAPAI